MDRVYLALAALVGGVLVALAGLWESHEPFNARKFGATVIRALFAGIVFAIGYQLTEPLGVKDIFLALLSATTFEVVSNRVAGALGNPQFPLPAVKDV